MIHDWPERWEESTLETIVSRMTNGANLKQVKEQKHGFLPISRIETIANEDIDFDRVKYVEADEKAIDKYKLLKGDVLFSHINSDKHLGKTAYFDSDQTLLHGINLLLIRAVDEYDGKLLNYLFRHYRFKGGFIEVAQRSVNQSSINQKKLKSFPVPIIPLPEQKRIVAKLDALFGHLDTLREKLDRIPELMKHFRQQVLTQAVTGKLTEEWRKRQRFDTSWKKASLGSLSDLVTSGSRGWAKYYSDNGSIFVRAQNIKKDYLDLSDIAFVSLPSGSEGTRTLIKEKDILITITGANVTKTAHIDVELIDAYVSQHVALIRLHDSAISKYVHLFLICESHGRKQLLDSAYGQGKPQLNLTNIKEVEIGVPSAQEQTIILEKVKLLFSAADKIETQYQNLKEKIDQLPQAILAKAFKGELVAQDENNEPAGVLLERIKSKESGVRRKKEYKQEERLGMVAEGNKDPRS